MATRIAGMLAGSIVVGVGFGLFAATPAFAAGANPLAVNSSETSRQVAPQQGYNMSPQGDTAGGGTGPGPAIGLGPSTGTESAGGTSERPALDDKTSKFDEMARLLTEQIARYDAAAKSAIVSDLQRG